MSALNNAGISNEVSEVEPEIVNALSRIIDLASGEESDFVPRHIPLSPEAIEAAGGLSPPDRLDRLQEFRKNRQLSATTPQRESRGGLALYGLSVADCGIRRSSAAMTTDGLPRGAC